MFELAQSLILVATAALIGAVILLALFRIRNGAVGTQLVVLAFVFLFPVVYIVIPPWLIDSRFRTYRAFYKDLQTGMTRGQVLAAMERRYPQGGARYRPTIMNDAPDALGFFMNPETSREPNCEGIFLTLTNGRVTKKEYSPD